MKVLFLSILIVLSLSNSIFSQGIQESNLVKTNPDKEQINFIDSVKQEIKSNLKSYKKVEKFNDSSDYRCVYTKDKKFQLISIHLKDTIQKFSYLMEYYFQNGQLIFAEQFITIEKSNTVMSDEKMYLDNQHLFAWVQNGNNVDRNSEVFKKADKELHNYIIDLRIENANL